MVESSRRQVLVGQYIQPRAGARILEIGCGPGTIAGYLPDSEYVGFDMSSKYIEMARKRFPHAQFVCERVSQFSLAKQQSFDAVLTPCSRSGSCTISTIKKPGNYFKSRMMR